MEKSLAERVWELHCRGKSCSEIDRVLKLPPGKAHDTIVYEWQYGRLTHMSRAKVEFEDDVLWG